ncbi:MAG: hypothetical protein OHK0015_36570 [Chloroflexi bacterium OHK40]
MSSDRVTTTRRVDELERWEYRVALIGVGGFLGPALDGDALTTYLNEAGDDGWEFVSLVDLNLTQGRTAGLLVILKRRK